eukprot:9912593-Ditylum_brightwellii.AAC.1
MVESVLPLRTMPQYIRKGNAEACCNCMRHSTCTQAVGVQACACRKLSRHCVSCACSHQCRNQGIPHTYRQGAARAGITAFL